MNSMKNRAMLTMQVPWFIATSPPEPTMAPTPRSESIIQRQVQVLLGQAAAGRPADLHRLEPVLPDLSRVVGDAAADVEDDLAQRGAERHFDQAGVGHVAGQGEGLGARRCLRAELAEVLGAFVDDPTAHGPASQRC